MSTLLRSCRGLASVAGVAVMATACCGGWEEAAFVDLGVSEDLNALTITQRGSYLAAGGQGTVVHWGYDTRGVQELESWTLGEGVELHAVLDATSEQWWVVGEAGEAWMTSAQGDPWVAVELDTSADLYAIAEYDERLFVVGDELVRVREADGTWVEPEPPAAGWGQLRAVRGDALVGRVWAVGLEGRIVSVADDDPGGAWVEEASGTEADLLALDRFLYEIGPSTYRMTALGSDGTMVARDDSSGDWSSVDSGVEADFINASLTATGELLNREYRDIGGWRFTSVDSLSGARTAVDHTLMGSSRIVVVGEGGTAAVVTRIFCGKV